MTVHRLSRLVVLLAAPIVAGAITLHAQLLSFEARSGEELYRAACAACHGPDGKGRPQHVVGFDTPLPDFTNCSFATPETAADWLAIAHQGGPVRAFDRRMPAFGQALSDEALQRTVDYVRSLCADRSWPRGELNLPRALVTEKAFPENETIVSVSIAGGESAAVGSTLIYERRLGARSQFELALPIDAQKGGNGDWQRGLGDAAVAFKHVLFHRFDAGSIVSLGAEAVLPTGSESNGLGKGVAIVEPFVALGQILPSDSFVQLHAGFELPFDGDKAEKEAFLRAALGKSFTEGRFGRTWSPIVEFAAARELADAERTQWDIVPQMQVSLSRRQHILVSAGLQIPLTSRSTRDVQVLTYLLWDWFDGGFFDGWK